MSKLFYILVLLSLMFVLSACASEEDLTKQIEELDYDVIHIEEVKEGVVVFHKPENVGEDQTVSSMGAHFIKQNPFEWEVTNDQGTYMSGIDKPIFSQYLLKSDKTSPFPMLYGEIKDPIIHIVRVVNEQDPSTYEEATVMERNGHRFWYLFLEAPTDPTTFEVQGLSKDQVVLTSITNADLLESYSSSGSSEE
ncbi:hypothetical protein GCM10008967_30060 [Bacillus carboniphilus]|uniref:Lipoprotein n=1 Tax=Bacillus carboniphilus TaxID=86663 RepID=A0ABN0WHE3_9BACI